MKLDLAYLPSAIANVNNLLTELDAGKLREKFSDVLLEDSRIYREESIMKDSTRKSKSIIIDRTEELSWVFSLLDHIIFKVNKQIFNFDINYTTNLQIAEYSVGSEYQWHWDIVTGDLPDLIEQRKLSLVIQLSYPEEYEGGEFQILAGSDIYTAEKLFGNITVFPSWAVHRVLPVTKGIRKSLTCWVGGPNWK